MSTRQQRIESRMATLSLTQEDVVKKLKKLGVSITQPGFYKTKAGLTHNPKFIIELAEVLECDLNWLRTGEGEMQPSPAQLPSLNSKDQPPDDDSLTIDKYDDVGGAMGGGVLLKDQPGQITKIGVTEEWLDKNTPANTGNSNLKVVTGFGDSMIPMFNPGDPILVDIGVKECNHDGVYFFRVGDEGYIKRLQRIPGKGILVLSQNPLYESWYIEDDVDFEVLGKVLKAWYASEY